VELLSNLGYACLDTEETAAALQHFQEALAIDDRDANSIYGMAMVEKRMEDWGRAVHYWRQFLELTSPNNSWRGQAEKNLRLDEERMRAMRSLP